MSTAFNGLASEMRDSPWLASEDLDGDVTLTIKQCHRYENVEFEAGRKKQRVFTLEFEKAKRQLVLNATNKKTLIKRFSNDTQKWKGKQITLYVLPGVRVGKEIKNGIRIR